ncbi:unnamed protein product [Malus baccata var. baccata]
MTLSTEQPELVLQVENHKLSSGTNEETAASSDAFVAPEINSFGRMREKYKKLNRFKMSVWKCYELLNEVHLLQTAESIRKDYPSEDWLHLTAQIHDLGKVLLLPQSGGLPQWVVYFKDKLDYNNPSYNTKCGIYSQGCGLETVTMSWRHEDYMYLVAKENGATLPQAGSFIIRYHLFYPLHKAGTYKHLMDKEDEDNLIKDRIDVKKVKPYYLSLIDKYFPAKLRW